MRVAVDGELYAGVSGEVLDVLRMDARYERAGLRSSHSSVDTTLIPPGTQYGATPGKVEKGKRLRYAEFASPCNPLQRLTDHS